MSKRVIILFTVLVLAALAGTVTKVGDFQIRLSQPVVVGGVTLNPGEYRVAVGDTRVTITPLNGGKSVEAAIKIEQANKKFDDTVIMYESKNNQTTISEIDPGGRKAKLLFVQ